MEFVLLGFLLIRQLSQYDMYMALSKKVSPFYSASLGSIQATLKKLEAKGYISVEKEEGHGRRKNTYTINGSGKAYFIEWMLSEFSEPKFDIQLHTRIFFLGHLEDSDRIKVVDHAIQFLKSQIDEFEAEGIKRPDEKDYVEVVKYQLKSLDLAVVGLKSTLEHLILMKKEMEKLP